MCALTSTSRRKRYALSFDAVIERRRCAVEDIAAVAKKHVNVLNKLRVRMVEQRRMLAGRDADLGYSDTRMQKLVALQMAIEVVDRAIADEVAMAPASAPDSGPQDLGKTGGNAL
jgi:hypothetical protein